MKKTNHLDDKQNKNEVFNEITESESTTRLQEDSELQVTEVKSWHKIMEVHNDMRSWGSGNSINNQDKRFGESFLRFSENFTSRNGMQKLKSEQIQNNPFEGKSRARFFDEMPYDIDEVLS